MLKEKKEFLFNILMVSEIPFIRIGSSREFILLDHKIRISSFEANAMLKFKMMELKYQNFVFENGVIDSTFLAKILDLDWIKKYDYIIL